MLRDPASFRDPAGFVFQQDGRVVRGISEDYVPHWEEANASGLLEELIENKLLIPFSNASGIEPPEGFAKIIEQERVPVISYPWEWGFTQLQQAALATLKIQKFALKKGLILKDTNGYNIQFVNGHPVLIDLLSFEQLKPGQPWPAYRQFCEHFLGPLALMHYNQQPLNKMLLAWPEGLPLKLIAGLLPGKSKLNSGIALHLFLHSKASNKGNGEEKQKSISEKSLWQLADHLESTIQKLQWKADASTWDNYYQKDTTSDYIQKKEAVISAWLDTAKPKVVWDLGANTGHFSKVAAIKGAFVLALESDVNCIEILVKKANPAILPLVYDVAQPSPAIGWELVERPALINRIKPEMIMALALTHHLRISQQVPFELQAQHFAKCTKSMAIVEFIPASDSKVQLISSHLEKPFPDYSQKGFEKAFTNSFSILEKTVLPGGRLLYSLQKL